VSEWPDPHRQFNRYLEELRQDSRRGGLLPETWAIVGALECLFQIITTEEKK
jgi:hypothetical protein